LILQLSCQFGAASYVTPVVAAATFAAAAAASPLKVSSTSQLLGFFFVSKLDHICF
jgi:hypothetical protein